MNFFLISLFTITSLFSNNWIEYYTQANIALKSKNYQESETLFKKAIDLNANIAEPYIGLAQLYLSSQNNLAALETGLRSLNCSNASEIDNIQNIRLILGASYSRLNFPELSQKYFDEYLEYCPNKIKTYRTEDYIYVYNAQNQHKKLVEYVLKNVDEANEIEWTSTGVCKAKISKAPICLPKANLYESGDGCYETCDYVAILAGAWCGRFFSNTLCIGSCTVAVDWIKRHLCYNCCNKGTWGKTCQEHFADILKHMQPPCYRGEDE